MFNEINILGFIIIFVFGFFLYKTMQKGPFIYQNTQKHKVSIGRSSFTPNNLVIKKGDAVIWRNEDHVLRHTVVSKDAFVRNSKILQKGDRFKIIFDRSGKYEFYSSLYKSFEPITITVEEVMQGSDFMSNITKNFKNFKQWIGSKYDAVKDKADVFLARVKQVQEEKLAARK